MYWTVYQNVNVGDLNPTFIPDLNRGNLFTQLTGTSSTKSSELQYLFSHLKFWHMDFMKP